MAQATLSTPTSAPLNHSATFIDVLYAFWLYAISIFAKAFKPVRTTAVVVVRIIFSENLIGAVCAVLIIAGNLGVAFLIVVSDSSYTGPFAL